MRYLRLFFESPPPDSASSSSDAGSHADSAVASGSEEAGARDRGVGQLVIASRESQYKVLHLHRGGLDRLARLLESYHFLVPTASPVRARGLRLSTMCMYKHYVHIVVFVLVRCTRTCSLYTLQSLVFI